MMDFFFFFFLYFQKKKFFGLTSHSTLTNPLVDFTGKATKQSITVLKVNIDLPSELTS